MKKIGRDSIAKKTTRILGDNKGASLILVSILAIIVLSAVIILRVSTTTFMASANTHLNQDQAYELAASLGESIDILVINGEYDIYNSSETDPIYSQTGFSGLPANSSVVAYAKPLGSNGRTLEITATVGDATYVYTKEYRG